MFSSLCSVTMIKNSNWLVCIALYTLGLTLFYTSRRIISLWIFIELNILLLLKVIYFYEESNYLKYYKMSLYYFLVQSMGSIYFLLASVLNDLNCGFPAENILLLVAIRIKIGLFPCSFWFFDLSSWSSPISFFFFLTLQKIPYFFLLFSISSGSELLCLISFLIGSQYMFLRGRVVHLLVSSSITSSIFIYFFFLEGELCFFLFFTVYTLCLVPLLSRTDTFRGLRVGKLNFFLLSSLLFLFLVGLPPLSFFFFKLDMINFLLSNSKDFIFILFFLLRIYPLGRYFKTFFKEMVLVRRLYSFSSRYRFLTFICFFFSIYPFTISAI